MVAVGVAIKEQGTGSRILNVVVGLAFFGYGFYLLFLFDGGDYRIFFYVFILPILLIVRAVKARKEARERAAAHQFAGPPQQGMFPPSGHGQPAPGFPPAQGQPAPYGTPQQGQPAQFGAPQQGQPAQFGAPQQGQPAPYGTPQQGQSAPYGASQQGGAYPPPAAHPGQAAQQGWHPGQQGNPNA
ncbi:hypothetical protein [Micromonospora robiginosa]|uniref:Uncharacterized protein n=1 Tax=Micromonospora robiginosa TaxID=2749844 RepID=A0A7L6B481_9ACTN|nr:hypothetical protein [Micromonospora ferruginea]QLQ36783.1 hypothetical protein H1D33_26620 [Micromonospora ferruginea]